MREKKTWDEIKEQGKLDIKKKKKIFFSWKIKRKKLSLDKEKRKKEEEKGKHGLIEGTYELKCLNAHFENQLESVPILWAMLYLGVKNVFLLCYSLLKLRM